MSSQGHVLELLETRLVFKSLNVEEEREVDKIVCVESSF